MDDDDGFQADDLYVLLNVDKKASLYFCFTEQMQTVFGLHLTYFD